MYLFLCFITVCDPQTLETDHKLCQVIERILRRNFMHGSVCNRFVPTS